MREVLNMTREEFSEKCNISSSFLAAVESGKKAVTSKTLYKICTFADISADYIIRGNNENFETDMILEMMRSLDPKSREYGIRILRNYVESISSLKKEYSPDKM
ncbi:MAG: helix-turn-helix transcriptional regulator [Ruminococcus sp.]|nr:helix-turn-helix transcriptional regulator [Ruminococcus sp.]